MATPPPLVDAAAIRRYELEHPVGSLGKNEIEVELDHWQARIFENLLDNNPGMFDIGLRISGIILALLGVPVCFASLQIGLSVACSGLCVTGYSEIARRSDARRQEAVRVACERGRALMHEREKRFP